MEIPSHIAELSKQSNSESPESLLHYLIDTFGRRIALASSLSLEDQVLTDMMIKIYKSANIFTLDTGRLFPETYNLIDQTNQHYDINIRVYFPDSRGVEELVLKAGVNPFYESFEKRKSCCEVRRLEPLQRAVSGLEAVICGVRREHSDARKNLELFEWDAAGHILKVNPLIDWTEQQLWDYIHKNNVPYNKLCDSNFQSIGCQPCTRATESGQPPRSGRWWWETPEQREWDLRE